MPREDDMTSTDEDVVPRHDDVTVRLDGEDGNVYANIDHVDRASKRARYQQAAAEFYQEAQQCTSYDEVLDLVQRTVATD